MNQVMISADSTCDLPVDLQRQRHVYCFALSILLGDTAYADGVEIRPADIYADVAENHRLPKTAAVPPGVYYDKFKQWTDAGCSVVHIGLSSAISSSYQNACTAAADLDNVSTLRICAWAWGCWCCAPAICGTAVWTLGGSPPR